MMNQVEYSEYSQKRKFIQGLRFVYGDLTHIVLDNELENPQNEDFYMEYEFIHNFSGVLRSKFIYAADDNFINDSTQISINISPNEYQGGFFQCPFVYVLTNNVLDNKYTRVRFEYKAIDSSAKIWVNGINIFDGFKPALTTDFRAAFRLFYIGAFKAQATTVTSASYPYLSESSMTDGILSYFDWNGNRFDFTEGTGTTVTSNQGTTGTIKTIHPDGNARIETYWVNELKNLKNDVL